jgi:hypothetical protein
MTEEKLNSLHKERARLLDAWRSANTSNKMSILVRIEDIDEQIEQIEKNLAKKGASQPNNPSNKKY